MLNYCIVRVSYSDPLFQSSTMLTLYLEQNTKFFDYFPARVGYPLPMSEMKLLCAALIFRSLGQLISNAHTVMELNTGQNPNMPSE